MQIFVFDDAGNRLAKYRDGKLEVSTLFDKFMLGYVLFDLMSQMSAQAGSYGTPLQPAEVELDQGEA